VISTLGELDQDHYDERAEIEHPDRWKHLVIGVQRVTQLSSVRRGCHGL
jgi:hypothetical protein